MTKFLLINIVSKHKWYVQLPLCFLWNNVLIFLSFPHPLGWNTELVLIRFDYVEKQWTPGVESNRVKGIWIPRWPFWWPLGAEAYALNGIALILKSQTKAYVEVVYFRIDAKSRNEGERSGTEKKLSSWPLLKLPGVPSHEIFWGALSNAFQNCLGNNPGIHLSYWFSSPTD